MWIHPKIKNGIQNPKAIELLGGARAPLTLLETRLYWVMAAWRQRQETPTSDVGVWCMLYHFSPSDVAIEKTLIWHQRWLLYCLIDVKAKTPIQKFLKTCIKSKINRSPSIGHLSSPFCTYRYVLYKTEYLGEIKLQKILSDLVIYQWICLAFKTPIMVTKNI